MEGRRLRPEPEEHCMPRPITDRDWGALQGAIAGEVVLPGSPGYELARKPPIARFQDVRPQAVVRCATPSDVAETISLASRAGLPIAARSGGHCFAGNSSTQGIVIDVTPMRSVSVRDGVATVGAGARLGDLYDALAALTASLLVTATGDLERPPLVHLFGAVLGSESDTGKLLDELVARAGVDPASAGLEHGSYRETKRYLAEHGPEEDRPLGHLYSKSEFFRRPLPTEAIAALVAGFQRGRVAGQSRELDFTPWGGAYNRVPADATAFAHRDERFLLKQAVVVDPDAPATEREAARRWLARSWDQVHPWGSGGVYPNFPDPDLEDWAHAYYGSNLERLRRVKRRYDPGSFFRFPQSIS